MGKGKTLRLKIAFVRAMMSRASMVGGGGLALAPSFLQLNPPPPPLQPTSELQPGCSAPCPCHLQRPIYSPPPQSQTHSQGISPWIRQHWGKDATPGKTGRYSKPFTSRAQPRASPLHRDAPLHIAPGLVHPMLHPSCFTTSSKHILPIPQMSLHWQFQRFIVWQSCYSTALSSLWLRSQGGIRSLIPSMAPQCPWELEAAGAAAVQELALKESWLGPHAAPPHQAQGGGVRPGMAVVRSRWPRWAGSKGHLISVIF